MGGWKVSCPIICWSDSGCVTRPVTLLGRTLIGGHKLSSKDGDDGLGRSYGEGKKEKEVFKNHRDISNGK